MVVVICFQATAPHLSIADIEGHQQIDCAVPFVLELAACNLSWTHALSWCASRQSLNVRLLVNTDQHLTTLVQPVNSLVTPQHLRRSRYKLVINGGSLPIPRAIRLQAGTSQYARHSRVVNRVNECLLDYDLLQRATIPMRQIQSICRSRRCRRRARS